MIKAGAFDLWDAMVQDKGRASADADRAGYAELPGVIDGLAAG